jgi:hypothetical protein
MAISSIDYAHLEHNKRQRKPAAAGKVDLESFACDCKTRSLLRRDAVIDPNTA